MKRFVQEPGAETTLALRDDFVSGDVERRAQREAF